MVNGYLHDVDRVRRGPPRLRKPGQRDLVIAGSSGDGADCLPPRRVGRDDDTLGQAGEVVDHPAGLDDAVEPGSGRYRVRGVHGTLRKGLADGRSQSEEPTNVILHAGAPFSTGVAGCRSGVEASPDVPSTYRAAGYLGDQGRHGFGVAVTEAVLAKPGSGIQRVGQLVGS